MSSLNPGHFITPSSDIKKRTFFPHHGYCREIYFLNTVFEYEMARNAIPCVSDSDFPYALKYPSFSISVGWSPIYRCFNSFGDVL